MAEEKRRYLRQVEHFCARVQNDWYQVYLVRKLTSQQGMEFVQSLSRQGHPAHWVFPRGVIAQQVSRVVPAVPVLSQLRCPPPNPRSGAAAPAFLPDLLPHPSRKMCASVLVFSSVSVLQLIDPAHDHV